MIMNMSIGCRVKACEYHHPQEAYCTLEHIEVGQSTKEPSCHGTDCKQFKKKEQ